MFSKYTGLEIRKKDQGLKFKFVSSALRELMRFPHVRRDNTVP